MEGKDTLQDENMRGVNRSSVFEPLVLVKGVDWNISSLSVDRSAEVQALGELEPYPAFRSRSLSTNMSKSIACGNNLASLL